MGISSTPRMDGVREYREALLRLDEQATPWRTHDGKWAVCSSPTHWYFKIDLPDEPLLDKLRNGTYDFQNQMADPNVPFPPTLDEVEVDKICLSGTRSSECVMVFDNDQGVLAGVQLWVSVSPQYVDNVFEKMDKFNFGAKVGELNRNTIIVCCKVDPILVSGADVKFISSFDGVLIPNSRIRLFFVVQARSYEKADITFEYLEAAKAMLRPVSSDTANRVAILHAHLPRDQVIQHPAQKANAVSSSAPHQPPATATSKSNSKEPLVVTSSSTVKKTPGVEDDNRMDVETADAASQAKHVDANGNLAEPVLAKPSPSAQTVVKTPTVTPAKKPEARNTTSTATTPGASVANSAVKPSPSAVKSTQEAKRVDQSMPSKAPTAKTWRGKEAIVEPPIMTFGSDDSASLNELPLESIMLLIRDCKRLREENRVLRLKLKERGNQVSTSKERHWKKAAEALANAEKEIHVLRGSIQKIRPKEDTLFSSKRSSTKK